MIPLKINLEGDGCWPDLEGVPGDPTKTGILTEVAYLPDGMTGGFPSLTLRCEMEDGKTVLVQTSARLFVTAAAAIKGKCLRDGIDILQGGFQCISNSATSSV